MRAVTFAATLAFTLVAGRAFADDSTTQIVEKLAEKGYQQQAAGAYADAIATYLKAYELSRTSEIIFNVATIYDRKLHERELASEYYRRYIQLPDATPDLVKRATERLTTLKHEAEEARKVVPQAPAPAPPAAPSSPAAAPSSTAVGPAPPAVERPDPVWRTTGIVVGAVGFAGVVGSLALGAAAKSKNDAANSECSGLSCGSQRGVNDAHDAGTFATSATIAVVAGGALLAGGVVLFVVAPRSLAPAAGARWTVSPRVGAGGGVLSLSGTF